MVSNRDKWIRIFDITDVSKHKSGFTIYKTVSMLYPESCPDAITKVTVWKRFNDFKKLHREIKVLHRKLNLKNKYPSLPSSTLFKRFDEETIQDRKHSILNFLEFVGSHSQLFTCNEFVKFFESSHTPVDQLASNINLIRADLNLPEDSEFCSNFLTNSDDEHTVSDTDSVTTLSSLSPSLQTSDIISDSLPHISHPKLKKLNSSTSIASKTSDSLSFSESMTLLDGQMYPTPPTTPSSSSTVDFIQYIIDASVHISIAIELENDKKYEEAFTAYKTAIDILLKYGKDDGNYDRKQMVRYKTEKYIIRAEKIYNMYLAPEIRNLHLNSETPEQSFTKRPLFDLYKFKVVKIIASGMLVLHSELQHLYYIKVIHKTMQFLNEHLVLPENVPYMLKLHNHYNCDHALFLVLEYCSGIELCEYLKHKTIDDDVFSNKDDQILKQILELSDNDSEHSYSDLINDYTRSKSKVEEEEALEKELTSSDDSYVKINKTDILPDHKKPVQNIIDEPLSEICEVDDLVTKSQKLLTSVDNTLIANRRNSTVKKKQIDEVDKVDMKSSQKELSYSARCCSSADGFENNLIVSRKLAVKWAAQLLLALEKLHALGIICRDLQSKNLLIDENGDLVLTYMCNAKDLSDLFTNGVNINLAPEVYSFQAVTEAVDWWSFGAILYELLVGMPLSEVHSNGISTYTHLKIPKYVCPEGKSILKQLLTYEPHDRLGSGLNGTENLKSHPFFNSVSWDSLLTHSQKM